MRRINHPNHARYLTFSTYKNLPLFANARTRDVFAQQLAAALAKHTADLYAWVLMPDHAHLLLRSPTDGRVTPILRDLKSRTAQLVLKRWRQLDAPVLAKLLDSKHRHRFWQHGGGHDRNIISATEFNEKIGYIHMNPVRAGLVVRPVDWAWSSARFWNGDKDAPIPYTHRP